jgi:hypothetical protein
VDSDEGIDLARLLPAWIVSGVVHIVILSFMLLIGFSRGNADVVKEGSTIIDTPAEESESKANLTNDEIGNDPELATNYNNDNDKQEISVPGPSNPNEAIGYANAPTEISPMTIAPPPGYGGGQGAGNDDAPGNASKFGEAGGHQGAMNTLNVFAGRSGATREKMVREGGGNTRSEAAVAAGLKWLSRHQANDGRWGLHDFHDAGRCACANPGSPNDTAGTGLGLLPFLAAGETHKTGAYTKQVSYALKWIIQHQAADGTLGNGYAHPICTVVLCEAYGLTADPNLKVPAQRAIKACVDWQVDSGGFRYNPRSDDDLSVTGWFVQALKSGQMAQLNVPVSTLNGINTYLDAMQSPDGGQYRYVAGQNPTQPMTAVGLLCRQYMGWGVRAPGIQKGVEQLQKTPPGAARNMYYYYYATQVIHNVGGPVWDEWNKKMRDSLVDSQDQGQNADRKDQKGSWTPDGDWAGQLGRLGYTSLALLTLEVYYRHLPLYKRMDNSMKDGAVRGGL